MRIITVLLLSAKRLARTGGFLLTMLLIPLLTLSATYFLSLPESEPRAAIYTEVADDSAIFDRLYSDSFDEAKSLNQLKNGVISGKYDCAFYFPEKIDPNNLNGCAVVYTTENTTLEPLFSQMTAAALVGNAVPSLGAKLLEENEIGNYDNNYEMISSNISSQPDYFTFEFIRIDGTPTAPRNYAQTTVYGIFALLAFAFALCAAPKFRSAEAVYQRFSKYKAAALTILPLYFCFVLFLLADAAVVCFFAKAVCGISVDFALMSAYIFVCGGVSVTAASLFRKSELSAALIPVFLPLSAAFMPVFADITSFFPSLSAFAYVLPPCWIFRFEDNIALLFAAAAALSLLGTVLLMIRIGFRKKEAGAFE